jgi:hypothetical protein
MVISKEKENVIEIYLRLLIQTYFAPNTSLAASYFQKYNLTYCDMLCGRPNYLMQEISIARQRIRITYPRIQLKCSNCSVGKVAWVTGTIGVLLQLSNGL